MVSFYQFKNKLNFAMQRRGQNFRLIALHKCKQNSKSSTLKHSLAKGM